MNITSPRARKILLASLSVSLFVPLLAACSSKSSNDPNNRHTLRIGTMYGSKQDEYYFRQQFTDLFEFSHDNIDIEVVPAIDYSEMQFDNNNGKDPQTQPDPLEKIKAIMTGPNPVDVMIFDSSVLGQLVNNNLLKQLDPLIKQDKIEPTDFVDTVINGIKDQGNGNLYALTPTFMPSALYYNKKLFSKAGVPVPTDGMNWDQVFDLAKRMKLGSGKDMTFGFSFNQWGAGDNYWDMQNYIAPLQLHMFDDKAEKMTVNTPLWQNVWKTVTGLYKDHVTPHQEDMNYDGGGVADGGKAVVNNPYQGRLFLNGKVAMTIGDYSLINDIQQLNANADKLKMEKLDWDIVTMPFHATVPGVGGSTSLSQLAGINSKAANPDDAWEFVKFMNGKEWAKLKSRSTYEMPARKEFIKVREGMSYNVDAFTKMKPAPNIQSPQEQALYRERPNLNMIQDLGSQEYSKVIQGQMSVEDALKEWETKGNDLLQKIKANPKGAIPGDNGGNGGGGGIVRPMGKG
jgi:multiple sugar transport system substrate-binding protein